MHHQTTALYQELLQTPFGDFLIEADEIGICKVSAEPVPSDFSPHPNPFTSQAIAELHEYFSSERRDFSVPLHPHGTAFQQKVWEAARSIPYGATVSYGDLAAMSGNPKAARGVGQALKVNPILIMIPCHRIIGKDGSLTGFGAGLPLKASLLALERLHLH